MIYLTILPFHKTITAEPGRKALHEILQQSGIDLETPCNGQGICGECRILVEHPETVPLTPHETISENEEKRGVRLACQLIPEQDMTFHLLSHMAEDSAYPILEGDGFSRPGNRHRSPRPPVPCLPAVQVVSDRTNYKMLYEDRQPLSLEVWQESFSPKGVAVDVGTTTIVVSLVCLTTGTVLSTASALNPQIKRGHDVMTRIQYGSTPEGLRELQESVDNRVSRLVTDVCRDAQVDGREILDLVVGGNTTMLQLAAGIDPAPLGRVPFTVGLQGGTTFAADIFGVTGINPAARIYVPPVAHAFVGTDISAGILVCEGFFDEKSRILFVDIGTNGELAINLGQKTLVTSTAAGPAFEGMGITSGMRAGIGAVDAVETDGDRLTFSTIGNAPARGICGSGMFDLVACLLVLGVVESNGRMVRPENTDHLSPEVAAAVCEQEGQPAFQYGTDLYFTQKDIRQVQLAKSPVRTAIDIFIQEAGELIDRVVLSGGFGHTLRPESLVRVGLLPPTLARKVFFAGNTSLLG